MTYRLTCVLFCLAACGGNDKATTDAPTSIDSSPSADAAVTAAMACMQIADTRCTKLQSCSANDLLRRFGDLQTCETRELLTCTEALAAPATGNNAAATVACNNAIASETCSDFFSKAPPSECITQDGPGSGACGFAAECTTGFCSVDNDALCGTCATQPLPGDSCLTSGCGQTMNCVAATNQCQVPVLATGACTKETPCADGFTCVGAVAATSTPGACTAEVATANAVCDPAHKTAADCSNDDGLECDTVTKVCVAEVIVSAGMTCGPVNGVTTHCSAAATCVITAPATTGTCVAPAADGGACDTAAGPTCLTPARCIPATAGGTAGTCQLPGSMTCS